MKRLLILTTLICLPLMALVGGVIAYERSQPVPPLIEGLSMCDGIPCYLGIVPGRTSWDEAKALFFKVSKAKITDTTISFQASNELQVDISQADDTGTGTGKVQSVLFGGTKVRMPVLYRSIVEIGVPKLVCIEPNVFVLLSYQYLDIFMTIDNFNSDQPKLDFNTHLTNIALHPASEACSGMGITTQWHGFTSFQRYESYVR